VHFILIPLCPNLYYDYDNKAGYMLRLLNTCLKYMSILKSSCVTWPIKKLLGIVLPPLIYPGFFATIRCMRTCELMLPNADKESKCTVSEFQHITC